MSFLFLRLFGSLYMVLAAMFTPISIYMLVNVNNSWLNQTNIFAGIGGLIVTVVCVVVALASFHLHKPLATIQKFGFFWLIVIATILSYSLTSYLFIVWYGFMLVDEWENKTDYGLTVTMLTSVPVMALLSSIMLFVVCCCYPDTYSVKTTMAVG